MKTFACIVTLLSASVSIGLSAETPPEPWNLVKNGHFDGGEQLPADWSRSPQADQDAYSFRRDTAVAVNDPGYEGIAASAVIERKRQPEEGRLNPLEWYQDGIAVEGGSTLFLIAFCRIEGAAGGSVSLDFAGENGRHVGRASFRIPDRAYRWRVLGDRTWRIIDELVHVPKSATQLRINLTAGNEPGRAWLDRITLGVVDLELKRLAQQRWHTWRKSRRRFPTAGWSFFSDKGWVKTPDKFQTYANAGFSMVKIFGGEYRRAVAAGLEPLVRTGEPTSEYPAKIGYVMKDEPQQRRQMFGYGKAFARILREDHSGAIPLLNNWGGNYVGEVIALQYPCFVMRTEYVPLANGSTRPHLYGNLEDLRRAALAHNIGFMGWALVGKHGSPGGVQFRQASESDLYWQVYSIVAYGAKGVWYYRYGSRTGLLDAPDQPNASYEHVRNVNMELHNLWPIVKHLRSTGVFHCQADPQADIEDTVKDTVTIYQDDDVPPITDFAGDKFLLGMFQNMDDPSDTSVYVMPQNKRHAMDTDRDDPKLAATARFRIAEANLIGSRFDAQAAVWKPLEAAEGVCGLTLGGGEGVLLRFQVE